jgi:WD40 repeat protein
MTPDRRGRSRCGSCAVWLLPAASATFGCGDGRRVVLGQGAASTVADSGADSGAFGSPVVVAELASSGNNDFKETLTADLLEIYFCSDRPGGPGNQDVWSASRASTSSAWSTPSCVLEVSSPLHETGPAVSADGLTLWVSSDRSGGKGGYDIWMSTRASRSSSWSIPTPVTELNTPGDEFPRPPGQKGLTMPASYRSTPNNLYQTFTATRSSVSATATWTTPNRLSEVDTASIDTDGFLSDDGLVLYFSSDRVVAGDQDLFVTSRPDARSPFGSVRPLRELSATGSQDRDPWLSPDGHEMYFSSDRGGTLKIYRATR